VKDTYIVAYEAAQVVLTAGQGIAAILPAISQFVSPFTPGANVIIVFYESILLGLGSLYALD
jgi:hypothetical protein